MNPLPVGHLPPQARELVELIGLPATMALVDAYRGQPLQVAKGSRERGKRMIAQLAEKVGRVAANKIVQRYNGTVLRVPKCQEALRAVRDAKLQARFDALTHAGYTARRAVCELVREFDLYESSVWRALKRPTSVLAVAEKPCDNQLMLF